MADSVKKTTEKRVVGDGTPGPGRPKGRANKVTGQLRQMVINALDKAGGEDYLVEQASANPNAFMALVGKVLPLQVDLTLAEQLQEIPDEALDLEIERLARETAAAVAAQGEERATTH